MAKKDGGTVTVEVEKRLEDLFRDDAESFDFLEDSGNLEDSSPAELEGPSDFAEGSDELQDSSPEELEISPDFLEDTGDFASSPPRELDESSGFEEESNGVKAFPLKELKTIVLSIDWEINDEDMTRFIEQVEILKLTYEYDRIILLFLQILGSLGKYIKFNKGNAHPNAVKVLNSVYTSLEKVLLQKGLTDAEKEKILLMEVQRFKELKEQVALRKGSDEKKKDVKRPLEMEPAIKRKEKDVALPQATKAHEKAKVKVLQTDISQRAPHEAFAFALEEIMQVLKAEFKALRAELKLWREGQ